MCHPCVSLQEDAEPRMRRPQSMRFSLFSEDEFGEDQPSASPARCELGTCV